MKYNNVANQPCDRGLNYSLLAYDKALARFTSEFFVSRSSARFTSRNFFSGRRESVRFQIRFTYFEGGTEEL